MAQCARYCARDANVVLTGELTVKSVTGTVKVFKKDENNSVNFYKRVTTLHFML